MINLHAVVRTPIISLHPDETVILHQSLGQANVKGRIVPQYGEGIVLQAQIQTLSAEELQQREDVSKTGLSAKAYLYASENMPPAGIVRWQGRNGDFIQRADGTWWLIVSVLEDFTKSGWECVGIAKQTEAPDFSGAEWGAGND